MEKRRFDTKQGDHSNMIRELFFIESFPQMCFEKKWLENQLRANKNELRSFLVVNVQGHQFGGFCIVPVKGINVPEKILCWTNQ